MLTDDMKTRRYLTGRELRSLPAGITIRYYPRRGSQRGEGWPGPGEHHFVAFHCWCPWAQGDEGDAGSICFVIKFLNLQSESFFFFPCHLQEKLKKKKKSWPFPKTGRQSLGVGGCLLLQKSWLERPPPLSDPPRDWEGEARQQEQRGRDRDSRGGEGRSVGSCTGPRTGL